MITISQIIQELIELAPPSLQEPYDNAGLITGDINNQCTGIICCLDVEEEIFDQCLQSGANLIIAHHPILFKPIKSLTPSTTTKKILIKAIKNDIAIYAFHTNYDNVIKGVNLALAQKIGLEISSLKILEPKTGQIAKLFTYVPLGYEEKLKESLFVAGAGKIGRYSHCSFSTSGKGSFRPLEGTNPFIGESGGKTEEVNEVKLEVIFPIWLKGEIIQALKTNHPYEEVAYEILLTHNEHQEIGSGMIGLLKEELDENQFLAQIKKNLKSPVLRHSATTGKKIRKVAFCGGSGSFLIHKALLAGADAFLTADLKYHDFFLPEAKLILIDIGHYESEIASIESLTDYLQLKFPTFAVLQTKVNTNPVSYYTD